MEREIMGERAQVSLEYVLLLVASLLVVALGFVLITKFSGKTGIAGKAENAIEISVNALEEVIS